MADLTFWIEGQDRQLAVGEPIEHTDNILLRLKGLTRVTVTSIESGHSLEAEPLFRRTDVEADLANAVSTFLPHAGVESYGARLFEQTRVRTDPFTLWDSQVILAYSFEARKDPPKSLELEPLNAPKRKARG